MKYSINNYVNALTEVLNETPGKKDLVIASFIKLIAKNGDISKRDKIIESVHKKIVNLNGGKWINVELARKTSEPKLRLIREIFTDKDHVNFKINPALIAGVRITVNGDRELDNSLNKKLNKLFK